MQYYIHVLHVLRYGSSASLVEPRGKHFTLVLPYKLTSIFACAWHKLRLLTPERGSEHTRTSQCHNDVPRTQQRRAGSLLSSAMPLFECVWGWGQRVGDPTAPEPPAAGLAAPTSNHTQAMLYISTREIRSSFAGTAVVAQRDPKRVVGLFAYLSFCPHPGVRILDFIIGSLHFRLERRVLTSHLP